MISKATQEDISAINILVNSAYRGDTSRQGWTTEADLLGGIRTDERLLSETFDNASVFVLKYVIDDKILGIVSLTLNEDNVYLGMLTVDPTLQNQGIGKLLLIAAEDFAIRHHKSKISMTVISVRSELIAWYERYGYKATGEKQPFPMDNPDFGKPKRHLEFIVMEKTLV
jgi:ribosomal protein S18 acetylase RimI-like enzyme